MPTIDEALTSLMGKVIEVRFLDHAWGSGGTTISVGRTWGVLLKVDDQSLTVQVWEADGEPEHNAEHAAIVRSTVQEIRELTSIGIWSG